MGLEDSLTHSKTLLYVQYFVKKSVRRTTDRARTEIVLPWRWRRPLPKNVVTPLVARGGSGWVSNVGQADIRRRLITGAMARLTAQALRSILHGSCLAGMFGKKPRNRA